MNQPPSIVRGTTTLTLTTPLVQMPFTEQDLDNVNIDLELNESEDKVHPWEVSELL